MEFLVLFSIAVFSISVVDSVVEDADEAEDDIELAIDRIVEFTNGSPIS